MTKNGKPITTLNGLTPLRTSGWVSRGYNGASGGLQTQVEAEGEEPKTASFMINANGDVVIGCLKNFIFRKRSNGGYTVSILRLRKDLPLDARSNEVISSMVAQYHAMKK